MDDVHFGLLHQRERGKTIVDNYCSIKSAHLFCVAGNIISSRGSRDRLSIHASVLSVCIARVGPRHTRSSSTYASVCCHVGPVGRFTKLRLIQNGRLSNRMSTDRGLYRVVPRHVSRRVCKQGKGIRLRELLVRPARKETRLNERKNSSGWRKNIDAVTSLQRNLLLNSCAGMIVRSRMFCSKIVMSSRC